MNQIRQFFGNACDNPYQQQDSDMGVARRIRSLSAMNCSGPPRTSVTHVLPAYKPWAYVTAGVGVLMIGVYVYMNDRPPGNLVFFTSHVTTYSAGSTIFGAAGEFLPSLCHVVGFSFISFGLLLPSRLIGILIPLFWGTINFIFELGQSLFSVGDGHGGTQEAADSLFSQIVKNHLVYGTFDWLDMAAILVGTVVCIFVFQHKGNWRLE